MMKPVETVIARKLLGKHVLGAANMNATTEKVVEHGGFKVASLS
jgi:hypothetical protein